MLIANHASELKMRSQKTSKRTENEKSETSKRQFQRYLIWLVFICVFFWHLNGRPRYLLKGV